MASLWYEGEIIKAIDKTKRQKAVFIVYVAGTNELSAHYEQIFNNEEVLKILKTDQFVAIKVEENSVTHKQFSALYPQESIPSVFFITKDGKTITSISKNIDVEEFIRTISDVVEKNVLITKALAAKILLDKEKKTEESNKNSNSPTTSTANVNAELKPSSATVKADSEPPIASVKVDSEPSIANMKADSEPSIATVKADPEPSIATVKADSEPSIASGKADPEPSIVTAKTDSEPYVATVKVDTKSSSATVEANSEPSSSSKDLSPEEKVQHAKELIEQRKELKRKEEEEAVRLKELERRKTGQNVQQMKRWQQDEELKQLKEERDREKRENQAARDRVLAQIAQDKAERAARFSKQGSASAPSIPQATAQASRVTPRGNSTRLQFRLPEGNLHTHEFEISDSLQRVHQYIQNEMTLPFTNYTISTTFPRREFNESDNSQTLMDLGLVPNAVILILPQGQGGASTSTSGLLSSMFWWILSPLLSIYDFMVGFIFGAPSIRRDEPATSVKRSASEAEVSNRNQPKRQANNSTEIKKQGNIHRLKERPDTDDENNTWNGNSTQQM